LYSLIDLVSTLTSEQLSGESGRPGAMYFEDLELGMRCVTGGRTVTEADIVAFAGVSGDFNPIHVDVEHASASPFGERIAHGALVLAIATGLRQQEGRFRGTLKAWLGMRDWRFKAPVRIGDTLSVENRIAELNPAKDHEDGLAIQNVEVLNQRGEVVAAGQFVTLMRRRPSS
jgi:acyl dehydratase